MSEYLPEASDERVLHQCLEQIVADRLGRQSTIVDVHRKRIRYIGSYDCDVVSVQLTNGETFRLFLKDYGFSHKSKDHREQRRERELNVYRDLFARTDLGTPEYYGSVWDGSKGRFWLLMELVEGIIIKDHNVEQGVIAADWLGRMQSYFIQRPDYLSGYEFLIRHDASFFRTKAELALQDVAHIAPNSAPRLTKVVDRYDQAIQVMTKQPLTLVHGAYIPWHVMLDMSRKPVRVCPIDWESAALGATLYDLAIFTDGVEPQTRQRIWEAYRHAATHSGVPVPDWPEMRHAMDCFRLHRIFDWLSRGIEKQYSEEKVAKLVNQAEQLGRLVLS